MIRSFNLDDDIVKITDAKPRGERSRLANKAMRIGLGLIKTEQAKSPIDQELIRRMIREELKGLDIKEKPAEKVSDDIVKKVSKTTSGILKMREGK